MLFLKNTTGGYIRKIKIEKAKDIFINKAKISINDVFQKYGFSDYNYFIYIFKKVVGITPKKFIKMNEIKETDS